MDKKEYLFLLNNKSSDFIIKMENYAKINKVPIIQKSGLDLITQIIKIGKCQRILEIGTAIGYSAINFALINDDIEITTIERDELMYETALSNIQSLNLQTRINVIFQDALDIDESSLGFDFDLLFIDAAKSQYQKFFIKFTKCLKPGALVIIDNLLFHDLVLKEQITNRNTRQLVSKIKAFNKWLSTNTDFDTKFFSIGDGIAVSIKK
jgi:predicted O-methyltransferase YrrM